MKNMPSATILETLCRHGHMEKALELLPHVFSPCATHVYLTLLRSCVRKSKEGSVNVKQIHAHLTHQKIQLHGLLGDYLVVTLAKCGALEEALIVSAQLHHLTVFSCTAIICAYVDSGYPHEALRMHQIMQDKGIEPNSYTFISLFKACGNISDLHQGTKLHSDAYNRGLTGDVVVGNALIHMYDKFGSISKAEEVFRSLSHRSIVTWNTMLSTYLEQDHGESALCLYAKMQEECVEPDSYTFVTLFKVCANEGNLRKGMELHDESQRKDMASDFFLRNTLVSMYGKCGAIKEAEYVFVSLHHRTLVSWNAMLSALVNLHQGRRALLLYRQMKNEGVNMDQSTFAITLQACAFITEMKLQMPEGQPINMIAFEIIRAFHADLHKESYTNDLRLSNILLNLYGKLGKIAEAENIFCRLSQFTVVSWNAMLLAYLEGAQGVQTLQLYTMMQKRDMSEDKLTIVLILQACSMLTAYLECVKDIGYVIHAEAIKRGFSSDLFICSTLVSMYGKCQLMLEAENTFIAMEEHTIVSWNAMLSAHVEHNQGEKALLLYSQMQKIGVTIDQSTCIIVLQACTSLIKEVEFFYTGRKCTNAIYLEIGQALHADIRRKGFHSDASLRSTLINFYGKCGAIKEAEAVFYASFTNDVVLWSTMISAYVDQGEGEKGLRMYAEMQKEGISPNQLTMVFSLQACITITKEKCNFSTAVTCLDVGFVLHADALRKGFASHVFVGNSIIIMYHNYRAFDEAEDTFYRLLHRDTCSWNSMLSLYVDQGNGEKALKLYRQMSEEIVDIDPLTSLLALQSCSLFVNKEDGQSVKAMCLEIAHALHSSLRRRGFLFDAFVRSGLVGLYGNCGTIEEAENAFGEICQHDVAMWTMMLSAYVDQAQAEKALQLYMQIRHAVNLDQRTLVIVLQACTTLVEKGGILFDDNESIELMVVKIGHTLHADACKKGFLSQIFVTSALISMYGKCTSIMEAEEIFTSMHQHDVVSYNQMMGVYLEQYQGENALRLYNLMQHDGLHPDHVTFLIALQACTVIAGDAMEEVLAINPALEIGYALHSDACKNGHIFDISVSSAVVGLYGKCGALIEAENVFSSISEPTVIMWNALYLVYVQQCQGEKALELYRQMHQQNASLDHVTVICVLRACSATGSLHLCRDLHFIITSTGCDWMPSLQATMIHAYGSCGTMIDAQVLFEKILDPDIVTWNSLLSSHACQGSTALTFQMFEELKLEGSHPDEITISSLLSASRHDGLVTGMEFFESMSKDHDITADSQHYETIIDLLGRAGDFKRIANMIESMPVQASVTVMSCLLGACRTHGNLDLAKQAFKSAITLQPEMAKFYVMMSNIYVDVEPQNVHVH